MTEDGYVVRDGGRGRYSACPWGWGGATVVGAVDHIFQCQKFTEHDRYMLYAMLGRTFFKVCEFDEHQLRS